MPPSQSVYEILTANDRQAREQYQGAHQYIISACACVGWTLIGTWSMINLQSTVKKPEDFMRRVAHFIVLPFKVAAFLLRLCSIQSGELDTQQKKKSEMKAFVMS